MQTGAIDAYLFCPFFGLVLVASFSWKKFKRNTTEHHPKCTHINNLEYAEFCQIGLQVENDVILLLTFEHKQRKKWCKRWCNATLFGRFKSLNSPRIQTRALPFYYRVSQICLNILHNICNLLFYYFIDRTYASADINCSWGENMTFSLQPFNQSRFILQLLIPWFTQSVLYKYCIDCVAEEWLMCILFQWIITTRLSKTLNIELVILSPVSGDILSVLWWMIWMWYCCCALTHSHAEAV